MSSVRVLKIDPFQFLKCVKHQAWGANRILLQNWSVEDILVFRTGNDFSAAAKVVGPPFYSKELIWDNGVYPNRIPIEFFFLASEKVRSEFSAKVLDLMKRYLDRTYGWIMVTQSPLPDGLAKAILRLISNTPNDINRLLQEIDQEILREEEKRTNSIDGIYKAKLF